MQPLEVIGEKCTLCGLCLTQCSRDKIVRENDKIMINRESGDCIACGHCYAVCPQQAIVAENGEIPEKSPEPLKSDTLFSFLRSRRSHRVYKKEPVRDEDMQKLAEFARYAPTGTNQQAVRYVFIRDPEMIDVVRREVMKFYKLGKKLFNNPVIRGILGLFDKRARKPEMRRDLNRMVERYEKGEDPLFHNAPLVVFCYADKTEASTPYDDCVYALDYMVLGAETMGLSSCINGLAMIGLQRNKKLKKILGFTGDKKAYTCATFGYPVYEYPNLVYRNEARVRIV
jgi:nitroreductase/NAD-dependent dihydropyrimidine dehydrogenase PreA subunit